MVEPSSPDELFQNLKKKIDDSKKVNPKDFLEILKLERTKDFRKNIFDLLEILSQKADWTKLQDEFLTILQGKTSRHENILRNQLITLDTMKLASNSEISNVFEHFNEPIDYPYIKKDFESTETYVENADILETIKEFHVDQERNINIIILGPQKLNGNHKLGSEFAELGALSRNTDFPLIATSETLSPYSVVHYPQLRLFKDSEGTKYKRAYKIQAMQVWSQKDDGKNIFKSDQIAKELKTLMRHYFKRALEKKIKILILTALGCGYMKNEPAEVARAIYDLLEKEYGGAFEKIIFAIKTFENNKKSKTNHDEFEIVFGNKFNKKIFNKV